MSAFPAVRAAASRMLRRSTKALVPTSISAGPPAAAERKVVLGAYYEALTAAGYASLGRRKWSVERAVAEGYERCLWTFKAVDAIASNQAALRFEVRDGEKPVDHPLADLLNRRANPLETGPQFRERLSSQILLSSRGAFVEVGLSNAGTPIRLDLLPPGRTRPVPATDDTDKLIDHYEITRANGDLVQLPPDRVRWFRKPHPIDPWRGMTPLEAAGFSIELDFFARLYNISFLRNDGRPGGVIAVNGEMNPDEMDRIEERFSGGPGAAGELAVINGELTYVDLATRPRDMAYQVTSRTAKEEILTAFGVGESVIGNSAGRTWDNAEQERFNFWTVAMSPHLALLVTGFDEDSDDDLLGAFDTSKIDVLQRPERARRQEALEQFQAGLISPDEYREAAGLEPLNRPETRALYIPAGKTRVARDDADQKALQASAAAALPPAREQAGPGGGDRGRQDPPDDGGDEDAGGDGTPAGDGPAGDGPGGRRRGEERATARKALPAGDAPQVNPPAPPAPLPAPEPGRGGTPGTGDEPQGRAVLRLVHSKAAPAPAPAVPGLDVTVRESVPDEAEFTGLETAVSAALQALSVRWVERAVARLNSPKTRAGTRHWVPARPGDGRAGTAALDAAAAVDAERIRREAHDAVMPLLEEAAAAAADALTRDLTAPAGTAVKAARPRIGITAVVRRVADLVADSAARQAHLIAATVSDGDAHGLSISALAGRVREFGARLAQWARGVSVQVATATICGARDAAAADVPDGTVERFWLSRRDRQVRPTHQAADGQTRKLGEPFKVGESLMMYPGDTSAPLRETANCRCRLLHRCTITGRFVAPPAAAAT